jgi:two-component system chemotaxis response regulator CheY
VRAALRDLTRHKCVKIAPNDTSIRSEINDMGLLRRTYAALLVRGTRCFKRELDQNSGCFLGKGYGGDEMNILVVDDSKAMRIIVRRKLREAGYGDCPVTEAGSGDEALEQMRSSSPDLLLCDWNMPGMSGLDLLEKLKESGRAPKFGFVTSEGSPAMRARATEAGAAFLISKPFTTEDFELALRQVA